MRTTLDHDEDILLAAKELARQQRVAAGTVISRLVRQALSGQVADSSVGGESSVAGFRPFAARGRVVSNAQVDVLRDQDGV